MSELASRVYYIYKFTCWEDQCRFLMLSYYLPWIGRHKVRTRNECRSSYSINNMVLKDSIYALDLLIKTFKWTTQSNAGCRQFPLVHWARFKHTAIWEKWNYKWHYCDSVSSLIFVYACKRCAGKTTITWWKCPWAQSVTLSLPAIIITMSMVKTV